MSSNKYVIIPAAGIGNRMKLNIPKQYLKLSNGKTILDNTLDKFINNSFFNKIFLSLSNNDDNWNNSLYFNNKKIVICKGGKTRFNSVYNALKIIHNRKNNDWVFVHDAVRPYVNVDSIINDLYKKTKLSHSKSGIFASKVIDTIKETDRNNNIIVKTINRNNIWFAQTPQLSRLGQLEKAFDFCYLNKLSSKVTDESSVLEIFGINPIIVEYLNINTKITTKNDLKVI